MSHPNDELQNEELFAQGIDMIKTSIIGIQQEIAPIKVFLLQRKKQIFRQISATKQIDRTCTFDFTQMFYEYTLRQVVSIEQTLEQCLVQLNVDLLTASKHRMEQPFYLLPEDMRRVSGAYGDAFDETRDENSCQCVWENVPMWKLEDTQDIIAKPRKATRTQFDETDLKFMQDIVDLRAKMFSLPRTRVDVKSGNEIISEPTNSRRASIRMTLRTPDFIEALKEKEMPSTFSEDDELSRISSLKFIDGKFTTCDNWSKLLDVHGQRYGSKWNLLVCPQIERIAKKRLIPALHLSPIATFYFLPTIKTCTNFTLGRSDIVDLLKRKEEAVWLNSWQMQFRMIGGEHIAATVIQSLWRGYWLRKRRWESSRLYVAASVIWFAWLTAKQKKELHRGYLKSMLISLQTTRELTLKLSNEFYKIIQEPHVVVHLPSLGYPAKLRRILDSKMFAIFQNITVYRICFVRNPKTEVIYVLPVQPTEDLLTMYCDAIECLSPDVDVAKRITFVALSQAATFKNRPLNLSRILHCSEDTLKEIRKKIAGKSAYFLPSIIDECDMRVAGNLNIPLLSPDMELQRRFLNASLMSETIDNFGLLQPPHVRNITDYDTLCESLAELMVVHTRVCMWAIKLNYGIVTKHCGIFLINHVSVPFMPMLRREREKHGDNWKLQPELRQEFLDKLKAHLPKIVLSVIQLSKVYNSWRQFYIHLQKYGCLLQAIPMEKKSRTVVVSVFVPGKASNKKPTWLGTADKINLESTVPTNIFMMPQSSLDVAKIEPSVNKIALGMQDMGYFGYMSVDCYCYVKKSSEEMVVLLLNVFPYYTFSHSYHDLVKFAIGGWFNAEKNKLISNVKTIPDSKRRKSSAPFAGGNLAWNETTERHAIAISQIHHTRLAAYRWSSLKEIFHKCGISYNRRTRQGSYMILHDGELRTVGLMVTISPSMTTALSMVHNSLTKLYQTLTVKTKKHLETNLPDLIDFFMKLSLDYQNLAADVCSPNV